MSRSTKAKILVVDDDLPLLRKLEDHLTKLGYEVAIASDGRKALALAKATPMDLVVLDINFPNKLNEREIDGIEVLRTLRDLSETPILMLSATNISSVKVMALTIGADDYVSKPFDLQELTARIDAILRRTQDEHAFEKVLCFHRVRLDPGQRRVWKDETEVEFTAIEFDLLYTLARRPNHVFTRDKLLEIAWKESSFSVPRVVDVHVGHIRKKIEDDPSHPSIVVTVRGTGYRFEDVPA